MKKRELSEDAEFNEIGISSELDWPRIRKLLEIGLFSAFIVLAGDMLLGYGVEDTSLKGMVKTISSGVGISNTRCFFAALLGLIGIMMEGLSYFGIYRIIVPKSPRRAHNLRTGIIGYIVFGPAGVHVPCCTAVFLYNYMLPYGQEVAADLVNKFTIYFMMPATVLFVIFFVILCAAQIGAFRYGLTDYPRWCCIFNLPVGMVIALCVDLIGRNQAITNAIGTGWISIGNIWMLGGLLLMSGAAEKNSLRG